MRCCVPSCTNDSWRISIFQGITFHVFPTESSLRKSWLRALGREDWLPKERSVVCSEHFVCDDLYVTRNGLCKLRPGAVPLVVQSASNCQHPEPATLKVCRICLSTDNKLFSMKEYKLEQAFEHLTGLIPHEEEKLPRQLCAECAHRVLHCSSFKHKSLRAHSILTELVNKNDYLTIQSIKTIDRENNKLTSNLSPKRFEADHCDLYIEHDTQRDNAVTEFVKVKDEIFLNENDGFNREESVIVVEIKEEPREDADESAPNPYGENDFLLTKEFSPDDGLPLEIRRTNIYRGSHQEVGLQGDSLKTYTRKLGIQSMKTTDRENNKITSNLSTKHFEADHCDVYIDHTDKPVTEVVENEILLNENDDFNHKETVKDEKLKQEPTEKSHEFVEVKIEDNKDLFLNENDDCNQEKSVKDELREKPGLDTDNAPKPKKTKQDKNAKKKMEEVTAKQKHTTQGNTSTDRNTEMQSLVIHIRTHAGEKTYSCNVCDKNFTQKTNLSKHLKIHTGEKPFSCAECDKKFNRKAHLDAHLRTHTGEKPYSCNVCGKKFSQKYDLVKHHRTHTGEKPYSCNVCDKKFTQKANLVAHLRIHTGEKPYSCRECDKKFNYKSDLVKHLRIHTGEKPYSCNVCGKNFYQTSDLVKHRRLHTGEKPYSCNVCDRKFNLKPNLVTHLRIHTGEKPYSCDKCLFKSCVRSSLRRHLKTH